jgi:hypothetical protein
LRGRKKLLLRRAVARASNIIVARDPVRSMP